MASMAHTRSIAIEDLANGINEWKNVAPITRETIKALFDQIREHEHVISSQADAIQRMERLLEQKSNRSEVQAGLAAKANVTDVNGLNRRLSDLNRVLESKAEASEVATSLDKKADLTEVAEQLSELIQVLDTKANARDVETYLDRKAEAADMALQLEQKADRADLHAAVASKAAVEDLHKVTRMLDLKANVADMNALLEQVARSIENISGELSVKADAQDVVDELEKKADIADVKAFLETKANIVDVNESLNLKANKDSVVAALSRKTGRDEFERVSALKADAADVNIALGRKADTEMVSQALNNKASKSEVAKALEERAQDTTRRLLEEVYKRVAVADFDQRMGNTDAVLYDLQAALATKADQGDFAQLAKDIQTDRHETAAKIAARVTDQELRVSLEREGERFNALLSQRIGAVEGVLNTKISNSVFAEKTKETMLTLSEATRTERAAERAEDREYIIATTHGLLAKKADATEIEDVLNKLERVREACVSELEEKVDVAHFNTSVARINDAINTEFQNITAVINTKVDTVTLETNLQTTVASLENSIATALQEQTMNTVATLEASIADSIDLLRSELNDVLMVKANTAEVAAQLNAKADREEVLEMEDRILSSPDLQAQLDAKADAVRLEEVASERFEAVAAIQTELELKSNITDVCALLDMKPNVEDVNAALAMITEDLDERATVSDVRRLAGEQSKMLDSFSSELNVARWIWKSGKTKGGHGIPWNVEAVNTNPNNFVWEKDKVNIVTMAPGLYEITFGFFAGSKPAVQLLVNGEPVLSAVNSSSYVVHHSSGRLTSVGGHSAGNITGLTLIDFVALPPKARLAISYNGDEDAEGFLGLRKL